jgi:hypothetical protein
MQATKEPANMPHIKWDTSGAPFRKFRKACRGKNKPSPKVKATPLSAQFFQRVSTFTASPRAISCSSLKTDMRPPQIPYGKAAGFGLV